MELDLSELQIDILEASIELPKEETLDIILKWNPSTGYSWNLRTEFENYSEPVSSCDEETGLVGGTAKDKFVLSSKEARTEEIIFEYKRSFDDQEPIQLIKLVVRFY